MAKAPSEMTLKELAQERWKAPTSLDHLTAKAEMELRRTRAQLQATRYMLASSVAAAVSAMASAVAAGIACYLAFYGGH
jgi:hypothetical protein